MLAKLEPTIPAVLLRLQGVSYRAGSTLILDDVSLSLDSGPRTILMGPNGSGKTTLLKLAMGLIDPSAGSIETSPHLRAAFVFQRPVMLRRSVAENVAFVRTAARLPFDTQTVVRLLTVVGLRDLADRPARKLSGGEQQRLAIARALAREPALIFLDEPTASLDPASTKAIEDVVVSVAASGVKIVMSTHDIGQARRLASDVVFLVKGRVVEHASGPAFFAAPATDAAKRFLAGELVI